VSWLLLLSIIAVSALTPPTAAFSRVGALILHTGENDVTSAVLDVAGGYAYFGTATSPGIVVKIRLSDFTRVGAVTLNAGENFLSAATIDAAGSYGYFGTNSNPGVVVKVQLAGTTPPSSSNLPLIAGGAALVILVAAGIIYLKRRKPEMSASKSQETGSPIRALSRSQ